MLAMTKRNGGSMDVQALRYFVEVVRQQGFTRAGEVLHVTQPAISKMVRALEEELGTPLLLRERRRVTLTEDGPLHIEALVLDRQLDVGAVVLPTDEKVFGTMPFVHDELRAVLHPSHPLAHRRSLALRELAETPFVLYRPEFALHGHILEACRRSGFTPHVSSESSHWDFIVAMVAANIGVALLPHTICRQLDPLQVRTLPMIDPVIPWDVALIWRRDRHLPPATRAWLDLARRRLGAGVPRGSARGARRKA